MVPLGINYSSLNMKNTFHCFNLLFLTATATVAVHGQDSASKACQLLQGELPGLVYFPGSSEYEADISHFDSSSTQNATCSVEPSSIEQVDTILQIIGRQDIRAPFAVKSGGHTTNVGFSSTLGVQIAMSKFTDLVYDPATQTVKIGSSLTWDQVYETLEPYNVTVVGGRVSGVGVGGLLLGGGYSWVTDQYGLGIDNIVAYDLVLPNGTYVEVTQSSQPDLFFALKGGLNNFGIITTFTVNAYPLSNIWGGIISYSVDYNDLVNDAISNFSIANSDPKAQMTATYTLLDGQATWELILFYAEGIQPDIFQPFLDIPSLSSNTSVMSFSSFLSMPEFPLTVSQGIQSVVPIVKYTVPILNAIQSQINYTFTQAIKDNRSVLGVASNVEPFFNAFSHSTPSAYPHPASRQVTPLNPWIIYSNPADTDYFHSAMQNLSSAIQSFAIQEGQSRADDLLYPNYALGDTKLEMMYGDNVERLREIRGIVDPEDVMGLAGGFKF